MAKKTQSAGTKTGSRLRAKLEAENPSVDKGAAAAVEDPPAVEQAPRKRGGSRKKTVADALGAVVAEAPTAVEVEPDFADEAPQPEPAAAFVAASESISSRLEIHIEPARERETPHVAPAEIGDHPVAEEGSLLEKDIHLLGPSNLDRAVWCRQLATMIEVGVPLLQSLRILSQRTPHRRLAAASKDIARRIEEGASFHEAVREHESVFTPLVCSIIRVGESAGILENSLVRLAQIMETKADMNRRVFSAIMYPAVALLTAIIVVTVIMVKAVPVFMSVYSEIGQDLPGPTRVVVGLSDFIRATLPVWLVGAAIAAVLWMRFRVTKTGIRFRSESALRLPLIGRITRKIAVARFARTIASLLSAGVPLTECLRIASETHENVRVGDGLRRILEGLQRGERVSRGLVREAIFPALVVDMIAIGEETGSLDRTLEKLADIYEADVDATLRGLATILEPILIILLGGLVVFIALAVMLPYFSLVSVV